MVGKNSKYINFIDHDLDFIYKSFKKHFVFFSLSQLALEALVKEMFYCVIKKDQYVFK